MKKIIKNILLVFVICFTILSIAGLIFSMINHYNMMSEKVVPILNGEIDNEIIQRDKELYNGYKEEYGEDAPSTILSYFQGYALGEVNILEMQETFLIISGLIGISIGIILSLTEKSKIKEVLCFIVIGVILALIWTIIFHLTRNLPNTKFFEGFMDNFVDCIKEYGIYYILIYLFGYTLRYFINKKNTKKLNKELQNVKKEIVK